MRLLATRHPIGTTIVRSDAGVHMYTQVIHDGHSFYLIDENGALRWYRDANGNGVDEWAPNSGNQIGTGWDIAWKIFAGSDPGEIYLIDKYGNLRWYRDKLCDGSNDKLGRSGWVPGSGQIIGTGWGQIPHVFPGPNGGIYVVNYAGELLWYQDLKKRVQIGPKLFTRFANGGVARRIGVGWLVASTIVTSKGAAPPNSFNDYVIYLVNRDSGDLCWYHDDRANGTSLPNGTGWAQNSGRRIDLSWKAPLLLAGSGGVLYTAHHDGQLRWYRDLLRDGTNEPGGYGWTPTPGPVIGKGWIQAPSGPPPPPSVLGNTGDDGGEQTDPNTTLPDASDDGWIPPQPSE
jgi:hypothetical protein